MTLAFLFNLKRDEGGRGVQGGGAGGWRRVGGGVEEEEQPAMNPRGIAGEKTDLGGRKEKGRELRHD